MHTILNFPTHPKFICLNWLTHRLIKFICLNWLTHKLIPIHMSKLIDSLTHSNSMCLNWSTHRELPYLQYLSYAELSCLSWWIPRNTLPYLVFIPKLSINYVSRFLNKKGVCLLINLKNWYISVSYTLKIYLARIPPKYCFDHIEMADV